MLMLSLTLCICACLSALFFIFSYRALIFYTLLKCSVLAKTTTRKAGSLPLLPTRRRALKSRGMSEYTDQYTPFFCATCSKARATLRFCTTQANACVYKFSVFIIKRTGQMAGFLQAVLPIYFDFRIS